MTDGERIEVLRRALRAMDRKLDDLAGPAGLLRCIRVHPDNRGDVLREIAEVESVREQALEVSL